MPTLHVLAMARSEVKAVVWHSLTLSSRHIPKSMNRSGAHSARARLFHRAFPERAAEPRRQGLHRAAGSARNLIDGAAACRVLGHGADDHERNREKSVYAENEHLFPRNSAALRLFSDTGVRTRGGGAVNALVQPRFHDLE